MDLLEHCHGASVAKTLGPDALGLPKDQAARLTALGAALSAGSLSRLWQMLLKAVGEVRMAPDPKAAVEMSLIRLAYAADLPGPEEALKLLDGEGRGGAGPTPAPSGGSGGGPRAALAAAAPATARAQPSPQSFEDVVALIDAKRDIGLKIDVERYVRLISFRPGAVEFAPVFGAPANLAHRLSARLKEWTGQPWLVAAQGGGGAGVETLAERRDRELARAHEEALAEPFVQALIAAFPGTELLEVRQMAAPAAADELQPTEDQED